MVWLETVAREFRQQVVFEHTVIEVAKVGLASFFVEHHLPVVFVESAGGLGAKVGPFFSAQSIDAELAEKLLAWTVG